MIQAIGFAAGTLTALAFVPQVVKTWRTKAAGDLSMMTLLVQTCGLALWIVYGASISSLPVIASNTMTMALMLLLIWLKLTYHD
jgi:MtN3 and saliva related transmembrane protein